MSANFWEGDNESFPKSSQKLDILPSNQPIPSILRSREPMNLARQLHSPYRGNTLNLHKITRREFQQTQQEYLDFEKEFLSKRLQFQSLEQRYLKQRRKLEEMKHFEIKKGFKDKFQKNDLDMRYLHRQFSRLNVKPPTEQTDLKRCGEPDHAIEPDQYMFLNKKQQSTPTPPKRGVNITTHPWREICGQTEEIRRKKESRRNKKRRRRKRKSKAKKETKQTPC